MTCPRRSGYNTSLFCDVQGDQCLDAPCYQLKVSAHIDREIAASPELVQIENGCSTCFSLFDLFHARQTLDAAQREFLRCAAPWCHVRQPRPKPSTDAPQ